MRFAFFDAKPYDKPSFERFGAEHGIKFKFYDTKLTEDTADLARNCDGVCTFVNDTLDANVMERLADLECKYVALRCAGYNNVDLKTAANCGLRVAHVPAYSPYAVAEHAMALLLTIVRRIHKAYIRTRDFNFSLNGMTGFDLHDKTVGVVGTGRIGRVFIDICRGFGMNVIAYDKFPAEGSGITYVTLDELWQRSDIISFHCPLTDENYHMVDAETIARMKKGVILINTSRGALIDAEALVEGIKQRKVGAACLDVYEEESNVFFHDYSNHIVDDDVLARLISMPNVIVTSHQAFLTEEALTNIADTTLQNVVDFFNQQYSKNEVCYKCPSVATCKQDHEKKCF